MPSKKTTRKSPDAQRPKPPRPPHPPRLTSDALNVIMERWPNTRYGLLRKPTATGRYYTEPSALLGDTLLEAIAQSPSLPQRSKSCAHNLLSLLKTDYCRKTHNR